MEDADRSRVKTDVIRQLILVSETSDTMPLRWSPTSRIAAHQRHHDHQCPNREPWPPPLRLVALAGHVGVASHEGILTIVATRACTDHNGDSETLAARIDRLQVRDVDDHDNRALHAILYARFFRRMPSVSIRKKQKRMSVTSGSTLLWTTSLRHRSMTSGGDRRWRVRATMWRIENVTRS